MDSNVGLELCHSFSALFVHCLTLCLMDRWCSANIYGLPLFQLSISKMQKKCSVTIYVLLMYFQPSQLFLSSGLLKSFVGMGLRGARASFHIYTLSLTSFFPFPPRTFFIFYYLKKSFFSLRVHSCRPDRATLSI